MKKFRIKSWKCETKNKEIFIKLVDSLKDIRKDWIVRKNKNRTVYRIKVEGSYYYVKLIHPALFRHKIRELLWFTKSYSEYKSALFLDKVGLDVVKVVGWGKKRYKNFLVTEDAGHDIVNARDFWLKTAKDNPFVRKEFLNSLSYFLRKCIYANFKHPDFHLGNILLRVTKEDIRFIFVDPDGVKFKTKKMSLIEQGIAELISSLILKELSKEEAVKLLIDSKIINNESEFNNIWLELRKHVVKWVNKLWKKRRKKVLSKNSRFSCLRYDSQKNKWYLRKDSFGKILLDEERLDINELSKEYKTETLSYKAAIQKWLLSFYLQFQSIPHVKIVGMYISHNNQETVIIYEKYTTIKYIEDINEYEIERIKLLCETAKIEIESLEDSIVFKSNALKLIKYRYNKKL